MLTLASQIRVEARAGWFIVEQKTDQFGNYGMQSTIISGNKVRFEHQTSTFIFDLDSNLTTVILPGQKVYWRGHHDTLGAAFFAHLEIQIELMIAQLPNNEREKATAELQTLVSLLHTAHPDSLLPEHFRIQPSDSLRLISGYPSRKYLFKVDSTIIEEIWVTSAVKPWSTIDLRKLNHMLRLFSKPSLYSAYRLSEEWLSMLSNGLLMRSVAPSTLGNSVMEVSLIRELSVRDEVFLPPAEYRQAGIEEMINIIMSGNNAIIPEPEEPGLPKLPVQPKNKILPDPYWPED